MKKAASASDASTPASRAWALYPAGESSRTTFAPAARASSAVRSNDPSSTTITSRAAAQPNAAMTFTATVLSSLRAGMTMSMVGRRRPAGARMASAGLRRARDGLIPTSAVAVEHDDGEQRDHREDL